ncbi:PA2778 family cysteine peptidase [Pseudomonas gingeri]|nr:PA2778 family cysteine peptidase [Pseudomonas gingeri]NWD06421.1 PA2778 family cysteine peptidase [Pseudomonas gingeri]NWD49251.1 PA2778 family cysteine peptidase [Pseudomonas gingeri]NWE27296.1 PA2778 family cysteine peptidase [Pseudomonas gingeri]NWE32997.1 PA2778 family cysteine peptidase [Pseudomonas gingeri]NWE55665.1 PA2778 family cysteine peptidase [Pseudomonas gingeri]
MIKAQAGADLAWHLIKRVKMFEGSTHLRSIPSRRLLVMGALLLALGGCAGSVQPQIQRLPERVELNGVPFFRGEAYQSGPGALASMLSQQGVTVTPGLLDKPLKLPGAEADLQRNMQVLAREYGMVVYPLDAELSAVLTQVAAGFPVMVRFNEGRVFSEPRYAVVAGYNRTKQTVLLRAGMNRRMLMDFDKFTSAWKSAGGWAVLIQSPTQLPAQVDQQRWLKAADELSRAGQEQAAAKATKAISGH